MRIAKENWKVLASLFPAGWQQMAWRSGAVERLRGFPSADVLLRMLLLHVARGYSLRETVVRAKLANWADISDVALLKRLRKSEQWLRFLCIELLRETLRTGSKKVSVGRSGLWMERSSESQVRPGANGGFCTAFDCRVWCVTFSK
jgi:hypothetical protein